LITDFELNTFIIAASIYTFQSIRFQISSPGTGQYVLDS